ncbi:MAG: prepilin-type N-terminal cleavage/methylation domain-containing protein [Planctomycetes bacterium]|nr:prepilin-type N-terminal cleavage/methylation domain-containing protein [Planctomycetota bacterium]
MRRRRGMTLIEVLVAMAIFLFGVTSLLGLFHFGGDQEQRARTHAELAPQIEQLVESLVADAWLLEDDGSVLRLRSVTAQPVPGAPAYHYDLRVADAGDPDLRRAELSVWRSSPERPVVGVAFLLPRAVPMERRLLLEDG